MLDAFVVKLILHIHFHIQSPEAAPGAIKKDSSFYMESL